MPTLSRPIQRIITILLGLALLGALWTTALGSLSSQGTAVPMLTSAGTELINPLLYANNNGVAKSAWATIEQQAAAHPNGTVALPGIRVPVKGSDIAGKSFADGTRIIYQQVAQAWYAHGISFAFNLPPQLQSAVSTYDPFVSKSLNVPGLPKVSLPQIPGFLGPLVTHLGLSPTTLTAKGHGDMLNLSRWFWIFSAALALALAVFSSGWRRLSNPAWSLFHASWHIALIGVIAWFLINHNKSAVAPYMGVVGPLGGAFFPIYGTAAIIGLGAVIGSVIAKRTMKVGAGLGRMAARRAEPVAVAPVRRPISQPPYQPPAIPDRSPFRQPPSPEPQFGRGYGAYNDPPAQSPDYGAQNLGQSFGQNFGQAPTYGDQSFGQPQPPRGYGQAPQPGHHSYDDPDIGSQGFGQAQQQRQGFGNQGGYPPSSSPWDLPEPPPANGPQPPSAYPGSPDYAPRPRPSDRPQQPQPWPPNPTPDRGNGGW